MVGQVCPGKGGMIQALADRGRADVSAVLGLLEAAITDEGADDDGVGGRCGGEDFHGCYQRPVALRAPAVNDRRHAEQGNGDHDQRQGQEERERDLLLPRHAGSEDDGDGESDEQQIGNDVAGAHGDEIGVTGAAFGSRIGDDLPVVVEGLTLGQRGYHDGHEGRGEEHVDELEKDAHGPLPDHARQALEELAHGQLGGPDKDGVEDARDEDQTAADLAMLDLERRHPLGFDIVGAPDEHDV